MELIIHPNPKLFEPSIPVENFDNELEAFVLKMLGFMKSLGDDKWKPIGLAAVQAGHNIRIFIAHNEVYINPKILWIPKSGWTPHREGCFSLEKHKMDYSVSRPYAVKLRWQDLKGQYHENKFTGFKAEVILHEMDHLEGKLCSS